MKKILIAVASLLFFSNVIAQTLVRNPYLQKLTPNGITIRWRTDIPCNSIVQFGSSLAYGRTASDPKLTTEHIVTLTNLTPATKYFYSIGTSNQKLQGDAKNNFYSAPIVGSTAPVRIWATGDFGNADAPQLAVRDAYTSYTGTTPTHLWIWLGDNAYELGTDSEFQVGNFNRYPDQFKSIPVFPCPGGHDYGENGYQSSISFTTNFDYFSIFSFPQNGESGGIPSNTPKYYSYNYANIHFISLDSYGSMNDPTSPMYTWLNKDLAANTQQWTVVYFHHSPYSKGTHDSDGEMSMIDMRRNIIPLLESYHVDVVLSGHSHTNERSYMIKGHYGNANTFTQAMKVSQNSNNFIKSPPFDGTIYAVCGTSGGPSHNPVQPDFPMPCMFFSNATMGCSLVIDVNGDNFSCKYLASTGLIVDQFSIVKRSLSVPSIEKVKNSLNAFITRDTININYILDEDANVKIELFNILGQSIVSFNRISTPQSNGFHNLEFLISDKNIVTGIYILRMRVNGNPIVKKIYIGK